MMQLPYVTPDFPGIGGSLKQRPEDFFVQEIPAYDACGEGEHVYCEIQKIRLTTFQAIDRIAAALRVNPRDIGYAGMKDAQAVSRQIFSITGVTNEQVMELKWPDLTILWAARHGNKIRLGHLSGNRFAIKVRDVNPTDVVKLAPLAKIFNEKGMPNYFGEQRFGHRGDNDLLGAALVRGDDKALLDQLLGRPNPAVDDRDSLDARTAFDAGDLETAMKFFPRRCGMERRVLARYIKTGNPGSAARIIDQRLDRLWISALQSSMFNQVVARRVSQLDHVMTGDLAYKHDSGGVFMVQDVAVEQPRAEQFEISPSGPLIGFRMSMPEGEPLKFEQEILDAAGLKPSDFRASGRLKVKGARRPLRIRPKDIEFSAGVDEHGSYIAAAFTLPAGSFATVFLGELMKTDQRGQTGTTGADSEMAACGD
jgi:tRNA pseudouridine13 synthase